ncbi:hypothetical protein M0M42_10490 [Pseudomonas knackmussii]|uniref:Uncharacterized protein n=1 Tax=Pseudomonas knackmussii TaxID=65741 RepID=A0ABY4KV73_9PSED|nr:hypothetical protein [Pseudomonas knackmussii]UPQ84771.1 hypothetical protein M0M42_10490 [Pseudomonas knackmussii]
MSFHRFQAFDPYLTFAEGERGFREKIFLRADGTPSETAWYGESRDGKGYLSSMWRVGRDAYARVAAKAGEQPTAAYFEEVAADIQKLERDLAPEIQRLVQTGTLKLFEDRDAEPLTDLSAAIEDAPDGWLTEVFMRVVMTGVVSRVITEEETADFEGLLSAAAVLYLDDYIIANQIGRGVDIASELVMVNFTSAKLYRETVDAAKEAVSAVGRRSASAAHKATNALKGKALSEWDQSGHTYSGMAAFARHRHKAYEVTERTLYGWVREHRRAKS